MKDKQYAEHIFHHYNEMQKEIEALGNNIDAFKNNELYRKAVMFDLLQICELFSNLSEATLTCFSKKDRRGMVDIRNYVAHGYIVLKDEDVWQTIHNDLPRVISILKELFQ